MRENKYRVWDVDNNKMYEVQSITFGSEGCVVLTWTSDMNPQIVKNYILLEYTNLKDKNGIEIYEGDIVEFRGKGIIEWLNGGARFQVKWLDGGFDNMSHGWAKNYEMVGNIYEDEELLNK